MGLTVVKQGPEMRCWKSQVIREGAPCLARLSSFWAILPFPRIKSCNLLKGSVIPSCGVTYLHTAPLYSDLAAAAVWSFNPW